MFNDLDLLLKVTEVNDTDEVLMAYTVIFNGLAKLTVPFYF